MVILARRMLTRQLIIILDVDLDVGLYADLFLAKR